MLNKKKENLDINKGPDQRLCKKIKVSDFGREESLTHLFPMHPFSTSCA